MNPRWRWAIAAGVVLALAIVLYFRLDAGRMRKALPPIVSRLTHATIRFDSLSFSFVHGLDVRLNHVRMRHTSWTIEAPSALLELHVVPLLLGKIELQGIYLHSPVIRFAPAPPQEQHAPVMEAHGLPREMMLDQLSVSDATLMSESGQVWISGLDMDIQDIGPNRMMRWELQARTGEQSAVGHGQLNLRFGAIDSGFGKLTLDRIPLPALRSISRLSGLATQLIHRGYSQLHTVLTLDIAHGDQWTLFGETKVSGDAGRPDIALRGRAYRDTTHALAWKDSFLQIGTDASLAMDGSCNAHGACTTSIRGRSVDLTPLTALASPGPAAWQPTSGSMDVQAKLSWKRRDWNLAAQAKMQGLGWKDAAGSFSLPDVHINDIQASARQGRITLKSTHIDFAKRSGSLVAGGRYDIASDTGDASLRFEALQDAWAPLLRLATTIDPAQHLSVGGQGVLQGEVDIALAHGRPDLHFSLDGTKAAIQIAGAKKPAALAAVVTGDWQLGGDDAQFVITDATLGDSVLKGLTWQRGKTKRHLLINRIRLDMQALRKQGVVFPPAMRNDQGTITGYLSTAWSAPSPGQPQDLWPGMARLNADLDLGRFGTDRWQLQGHVTFDHGKTALQDLKLTGAHGSARLHGTISFASMKGRLDIPRATLSWNSGNAVPAWLTAMHLKGRIKDLGVTWLGQSWSRLSSWYRLDAHALKLTNLRAGLGDGNIASRSFAFDFKPGALGIKGTVQIGAMHVQRLQGLDTLLQGHLTGKAFATLKVDGNLPPTHWADWRTDGNIMIYGGSWRPQALKGAVQAIHHFDVMGLRFRNRHGRASIRNIHYEDASGRYTGKATLATNGAITGSLTRRKDHAVFKLGGTWPYPTSTQAVPSAH